MKLNYKLLAGGAGLLIVGWLVFGHGTDKSAGQHAQAIPVTASEVMADPGEIADWIWQTAMAAIKATAS